MAKKMQKVVNTIELTMEERVSVFEEEGKKTAKAVCGSGQCLCSYYNCGHPNVVGSLRQIGSDTTCPLAKYHAEVDTRPWWDPSVERVTIDGLLAVCALCDNASVSQEGDEYVINRPNLTAHCLDCPIHLCIDNITECEAEARMS